jgi:hypothetical protein
MLATNNIWKSITCERSKQIHSKEREKLNKIVNPDRRGKNKIENVSKH